ncbi:SpoIIE family protein phosphatase [Sulfidibacter corallicola]|uniref:SpoIIE family protein phosphatase n=1 Tax=Sulfidibacter corallicola TaxID=2818388 RepID=A0A8A4TWP8_SULCO|nr:SpoIIE family protein phosphatase [Sulfidibacter corallicola]QTD53608.1 SpoIIE family protein phosphatase [Sulfidibacter corallicola]
MEFQQLDGTVTLLGADFAAVGATEILETGPGIVAGMTAGKKASVRRKRDPNEDAAVVVPAIEDGRLLMVADSHFGDLASRVAVQQAPVRFAHADGPVHQRLFLTHYLIDEAIKDAKPPEADPGCATTLLSVFMGRDRMFYCSSGDSYLWLIRDGRLIQINQIERGVFLGESHPNLFGLQGHLASYGLVDALSSPLQIAMASFVVSDLKVLAEKGRTNEDLVRERLDTLVRVTELHPKVAAEELLQPWHALFLGMDHRVPDFGQLALAPGDLVFLATDGIEEEFSDCSLKKLETILTGAGDLEAKATKVMKACMGWGGGRDNLAFLLAKA